MPKLVQYLLLIQGIYYVATGLWGVVDIRSFEMATGPKTDIWLVKTISLLLIAAGVAYTISAKEKKLTVALKTIIIANAAVLLFIDVYYNFKGTISNIYLIDGFMQMAFILIWLFNFMREQSE